MASTQSAMGQVASTSSVRDQVGLSAAARDEEVRIQTALTQAAQGELVLGEEAVGEVTQTAPDARMQAEAPDDAAEWVEPARSIDLRSLDRPRHEAPQQIDLTRIERLQAQSIEMAVGRSSLVQSSSGEALVGTAPAPAPLEGAGAEGHRSVTERVTGPIPIAPSAFEGPHGRVSQSVRSLLQPSPLPTPPLPAIDGQAGLAKGVVSGPMDLPLTRRELREPEGARRSVRYHVGRLTCR